MAGLGALIATNAGLSQGRADAYKDAMTRAQQQAQLAIEQEQADNAKAQTAATIENDKAARAEKKRVDDATILSEGVDPTTGKIMPAPSLPPGLMKYGKTPQDEATRYTHIATYLTQQGRPDLAKPYQDAANAMVSNAYRSAEMTYTAGPKTAVANSQVGLNDARSLLARAQAAAAADLPARARAIAAGHDASSLQRASMEISGRQELAQYNGNVRAGLVQLAAAYRANNMAPELATRLAIATMQDDARMKASQMQAQLVGASPAADSGFTSDPGAAYAQAMALMGSMRTPAVSMNITFDRNGNPVSKPAVTSGGAAKEAGGSGGAPPVNPDANNAGKISTLVRSALKNGKTPQQVRAAAQQAGYSLSLVDQALRSAATPAPPPVSGPPRPQPLPVLQGVSPQLLGQ